MPTPTLRRIAGTTLALGLLLPASACAEVHSTAQDVGVSITLPDGAALQDFVAGARAQIDTIGTDVSALGARIGELPDAAGKATREATDRAQEAQSAARAALDQAADARAGAEERLADACTSIENAREATAAALAQLQGTTGAAADQARAGLQDLAASLSELEDQVTGE